MEFIFMYMNFVIRWNEGEEYHISQNLEMRHLDIAGYVTLRIDRSKTQQAEIN
jgi:hypothetical protein